jgi:hypothetical protein
MAKKRKESCQSTTLHDFFAKPGQSSPQKRFKPTPVKKVQPARDVIVVDSDDEYNASGIVPKVEDSGANALLDAQDGTNNAGVSECAPSSAVANITFTDITDFGFGKPYLLRSPSPCNEEPPALPPGTPGPPTLSHWMADATADCTPAPDTFQEPDSESEVEFIGDSSRTFMDPTRPDEWGMGDDEMAEIDLTGDPDGDSFDFGDADILPTTLSAEDHRGRPPDCAQICPICSLSLVGMSAEVW